MCLIQCLGSSQLKHFIRRINQTSVSLKIICHFFSKCSFGHLCIRASQASHQIIIQSHPDMGTDYLWCRLDHKKTEQSVLIHLSTYNLEIIQKAEKFGLLKRIKMANKRSRCIRNFKYRKHAGAQTHANIFHPLCQLNFCRRVMLKYSQCNRYIIYYLMTIDLGK